MRAFPSITPSGYSVISTDKRGRKWFVWTTVRRNAVKALEAARLAHPTRRHVMVELREFSP